MTGVTCENHSCTSNHKITPPIYSLYKPTFIRTSTFSNNSSKKNMKSQSHHPLVMSSLPFVSVLLLLVVINGVNSFPLSTKSRWIIDTLTGQRVKLRCANWPGHLQPVIPEGLNRKPADVIAAKVADLGFNCIRLTWSIHMVTRPEYANRTVAESLTALGLTDAVAGVKANNPSVIDRPVIEAFDLVVRALGKAGVMVILDNHVSKPMWCCGFDDGNGFFGDQFFDPEDWLKGLEFMAKRYVGVAAVVGMSLRNELRGKNSTADGWYKYMSLGAKTIQASNPDVLIIVSGLNYDCDLSFLRTQPFPIQTNKLVYEAHWYAFSEGREPEWVNKSLNWVCSGVTNRFDYRIGFVSRTTPLLISEFGYDQRRVDVAGVRFLNCFMRYAARMDIDWAVWSLQGSYYVREGTPGFEETYGVLDRNWDQIKDPDFKRRFRLIQQLNQDPGSSTPSYLTIYHPSTGMCLSTNKDNAIELADCQSRSRWTQEGDGAPIRLSNTSLCLRLEGNGLPVTLSSNCTQVQSQWSAASDAKLQIAGVDEKGKRLCMDWTSANSTAVVTKECLCLQGENCSDDPQTQWFVLASSNVGS